MYLEDKSTKVEEETRRIVRVRPTEKSKQHGRNSRVTAVYHERSDPYDDLPDDRKEKQQQDPCVRGDSYEKSSREVKEERGDDEARYNQHVTAQIPEKPSEIGQSKSDGYDRYRDDDYVPSRSGGRNPNNRRSEWRQDDDRYFNDDRRPGRRDRYDERCYDYRDHEPRRPPNEDRRSLRYAPHNRDVYHPPDRYDYYGAPIPSRDHGSARYYSEYRGREEYSELDYVSRNDRSRSDHRAPAPYEYYPNGSYQPQPSSISGSSTAEPQTDDNQLLSVDAKVMKTKVSAGAGLHLAIGDENKELVGAEAQKGPAFAKAALSAKTAARVGKEGASVHVLGTGVSLGRETSISLFGTKVGLKLW